MAFAQALPGPSATLDDQLRQLALDLHALLADLDPKRWRAEMQATLLARLTALRVAAQELATKLAEQLPSPEQAREAVYERVRKLSGQIEELRSLLDWEMPRPTLPADQMREQVMALRARLQPAYEGMTDTLKALDVHVPHLRPSNYTRNIFHFSSALTALVIIALSPTATVLIGIAGALFVLSWFLEGSRRLAPAWNDRLLAVLGPLAHPHEARRVNSATWYNTALFGLAMTGSTTLCALGVAVLGVGDPIAAVIGRRWGRIKLLNGRSLEGSLAFWVTATVAAFVVLRLWQPELAMGATLIVAAGCSLAGAVAEAIVRRIDDNFAIPLATAAAAATIAQVMGLGPL